MLPPLTDERRRELKHLATFLCCGTFAVLAAIVQSGANARAGLAVPPASVRALSVVRRAVPAELVLARDPFLPDVRSRGEGGHAAAHAAEDVPVVRAVVVGQNGRALVERGADVQVLGVGDALAGSVVVAIDAAGIVLLDGRRVPLAPEER